MYNTIYPAYAKSYLGIQNKQIKRKQEEETGSQSSNQAENNPQEERKHSASNSYFPNGERVAIDYTKRQIGIEQVLADFRNTANAIGAPDDVKMEVSSYLALIENQAKKDNPNSQIIQTNLKNASQILDEYITNTLKKPSKVVENWVDTLFLQQINYKMQKQEGIEQASGELAETAQEAQNISEQEDEAVIGSGDTDTGVVSSSDIYVPSDPQLKRMFIQAKKYAAIDAKERALYSFQNVMEYADEIGDSQACAMIHFEEARLYDDFNQLEEALYNYDRAAKQSSDNNIKAKSHMYMGKIYDDYVRLEPAIDHYCAAVSFAGEADNLKLQTKALSDLAQLHTEKYDKSNALMFMELSDTVAQETGEDRVIGLISSKNGNNCEKLGERARALKYFGNSAKAYSDIKDSKNLAENYVKAADIMLSYGNSAKAKKLLGKAYLAAQNGGSSELKQEITGRLAKV